MTNLFRFWPRKTVNRKTKSLYLLFAVTAIQLLPNIVAACPRCFGAGVNTPITQGVSYAMLSLIVVTGGVLTGFSLFFLKLKKRLKMYELEKLTISQQRV